MLASVFAAALGMTLTTAVSVDGTDPGLQRHEFAETHMGSEFKIVLYSPDEQTARRASRSAHDRIKALDAIFSDYQPDSELMRLCAQAGGPPARVSDDLLEILLRSRALFERSQGAFDVTVGPIVRLWRRARRDRKMPDAELLSKARALVSMDLVEIDRAARTVRLQKRGMKLDLGGIAKGYASDAAIATLRAHGITRALVAGAGDVVVSGPPPGRDGWVVGIGPLDDPNSRPSVFLSLRDAAVSTSGDAERFVMIDGKRYSHIVDPRTGLGIVNRSSVTVIAPNGTTADALATAVYGLGTTAGLALVESTEGASAYVVTDARGTREVRESHRFRAIQRPEAAVPSGPAHRTR